MQKKIIALAVAGLIAAPAFAQSSVTISGYVSSGVSFSRMSGAVAPALNGSMSSIYDARYSRIRFTGVEDLGGGLKADFNIETRFTNDVANLNGFGGGNDWVGLSGSFGSIKLGRIDKYYSDGIGIELSRANSFWSHGTLSMLAYVENQAPAGLGRWNNLIQYDTPRMSGFQATLAYSSNRANVDGGPVAVIATTQNNMSTGTSAGSLDKGDAWYASANYMNGPVYVGASIFDSDTEGNLAGAGSSGYRLYGSYRFPFGLKLGLAYDHAKVDFGAGAFMKRNAWLLPVSYSFGPHAIYFAYGHAERTRTAAGATPNSGARFWNIGYDYALSKRTAVGANWSRVHNKNASIYPGFLGGITDTGSPGALGATGMSVRQFGINLVHSF